MKIITLDRTFENDTIAVNVDRILYAEQEMMGGSRIIFDSNVSVAVKMPIGELTLELAKCSSKP